MNLNKMKGFKWLLLGGCALATVCLAEVPVEDLTQQDSPRPRPSRAASLPSPVESSNSSTSSISEESPISVESPLQKPSTRKSDSSSILSAEQRLDVLERKIENLLQIDPLGRVNRLQTDIDRLRGQLEVQEHANKQLTEQLKAQYKDLSQRTHKTADKEKEKEKDKPKDKDNDKPTAKTDSATKETPATDNKENKDSKDKNSTTEKEGYDSAINLLKKRDYVQATSALQHYLRDYPNGQDTASAHYWLGEIYSYQGQPDLAIAEYKTVISQYPSDAKVSDALLKLGIAYDDAGDQDKAQEQLQAVVTRFPNTETAQLADTRLKKIKKSKAKAPADNFSAE